MNTECLFEEPDQEDFRTYKFDSGVSLEIKSRPIEVIQIGISRAIWYACHEICKKLDKHLPEWKPTSIIELGAGVGMAGIYAAKIHPEATKVVITDICPKAIEIAVENIEANKL